MSSFEKLRMVDNFYQTSAFYPMPTVLISTLSPNGKTNLGPYSLVAPYYIAGKDYYAMLLCARNSSNTAQHILRHGKCAINFVTDEPSTFKECVKLSWPGDTPADKLKVTNFKLEKSQIEELALLNTIPAHPEAARGRIRYLTVAPMFAEAIERIYEEVSISSLYR